MSFEFIFGLNLGFSLDLVVCQRFALVELHKNHHLEASHVDFIFFIKVGKDVKRAEIELPWKDSAEFLFFMGRWGRVKFFGVKICKNINWLLENWRNHTCDLSIVWPVARRKDLYLNIKGKLFLLLPFLKVLIEPFWELNIFDHCVHFLSVGTSTFLFKLLYESLLS